jgi:hypothetical protein
MDVQPLTRVGKPGYPTRDELLRHPRRARRLLARRAPVGAELATAAGLLIALGLGACRERPSSGPAAEVPRSPGDPGTPALRATALPTPRPTWELAHAVVAPVFEFGEGRGAVGCVVVSPPAFLSEEEAMLVIKEELAKHGIHLGPGAPLPGVTVSPRVRTTQSDIWTDYYDIREDTSKAGPLQIDGTDAEAGVSVVFVSEADYPAVGVDGATTWQVDARGNRPANQAGTSSSVSAYDFREAAHYVATKAADSGLAAVRLGVFYDPVPSDEFYADDSSDEGDNAGPTVDPQAALEEKSRELLRMQVRSFVTWLESEDAVP